MTKCLPKHPGQTNIFQLAEIHVLCKTALAVMDEGIHIIDRSGQTVFYNTTMANLEGLIPSEVIGRPLHEVFPNLTPETSTLLKALNSGKPIYDYIQTYYTLEGASVTTINSTIPIRSGGECLGAVEIAKDISRIEHLARAVRKMSQSSDAFPFEEVNTNNGTVYSFKHLLGKSRPLLKAKEIAEVAARSEHPVLIHGETGVGKEVFAQSIHNGSSRAAKPFVAVNCAALPESLLESTLFGTVRGAFTGALDKQGLFEEAQGGTLFLDELNSMSPSLQVKLLRVLEEKTIRRVGSTQLIPVNVRIMASTGIDPFDALDQNQLRQDLYFRIAVNIIRIPPLRERGDDIAILITTFSHHYSRATGRPVPVFKSETLDFFRRYSWPGNVRELKNLIMTVTDMYDKPVTVSELPEHFRRAVKRSGHMQPGDRSSLKAVIDNTEVNMIKSSLENTGGNVAAAARLLGISRQSLQYKIRKYGIEDVNES